MDALKNFDEIKPRWCRGSLEENRSRDGRTVIYYANFGSACGGGKYQTALMEFGMRGDTSLAARQIAAAQKVLNKVSLPYVGVIAAGSPLGLLFGARHCPTGVDWGRRHRAGRSCPHGARHHRPSDGSRGHQLPVPYGLPFLPFPSGDRTTAAA